MDFLKRFFKFRLFKQNNDGQIFLVGGVTLTVTILLIGIVFVNLSDVYYPIDKRSFIKSEYDNVRKEFGKILQYTFKDNLDTLDEKIVYNYFNSTRDVFVFVESAHGSYFNAEFLGVYCSGNEPVGLIVNLSLSKGDEYVNEEILYYIY